MGVYRKATRTTKYLDFHSHTPAQSKRAVVKSVKWTTLNASINNCTKTELGTTCYQLPKAIGYPENFIKSVDQPNNAQPKPRENPKAYTSIPYIKGVSERIRRILKRENIKATFKPLKTLGHVSKKPAYKRTL